MNPTQEHSFEMPRAATTTDAFNAVAEPRRREILDVLAGGERQVNEIVEQIDLAQPTVSKHLKVLREVGLVNARRDGRRRIYWLNAVPLKPIHEWVKEYQQAWEDSFQAMDEVLEELKSKEDVDGDEDE